MHTLVNIIKEHFEYRHQIFKLAKADIVKTYRGAALGWAWAVIKPAVTIFVYWFTFQIGIRGGGDKIVDNFPFFLWLICGMIPWFYMNDMLTQGTDSVRKYSYLVTKMKFPVSTIPTFVSISKLIVHLILLVIMGIIFTAMGYPPTIYWLQLPFYLLLNFIFFTVLTLFSSLLSAISKDFSNLVKSMITAIFWLSGIVWNVNTLDVEKYLWIKKLMMVNPITYLVEGYRNCFIHQIWFFEQPKRLLYFGIILLVMIVLAIWIYRKLRKEIPDVLN